MFKIFILLILLTFQVFGQTKLPNSEYRGIHQIELENHRDYVPEIPNIQTYSALNKTTQKHLSHEIFGYLPYWRYSSVDELDYDLLTTISYFSAEVTKTGEITNIHQWPPVPLINQAHNKGVCVVLTATLFSSSGISTLLSNPSYRTNCITNLLELVVDGNGDGINIDFEGVQKSQRNNLVFFMEELADSFRTNIPDAQISMATPAVDWSDAWDYYSLAEICDLLFIMGYGFHWSGSDEAGPVAPLTGGNYNVTNSINEYLTQTNHNSQKIVLGVPYYGYLWQTNSNSIGASTVEGSASAKIFTTAESEASVYGKLWYRNSQTPWYYYYDDNWFQCWYDDSLSLALKYELAKSKNLLGVGIWALGYDTGSSKLWGALRDGFYSDTTLSTQKYHAESFSILQNYPNPANPGTIFPIQISEFSNNSKVKLSIYDLLGNALFTDDILLNNSEIFKYYWNGKSNSESVVPSGVYVFKLSDQNHSAFRKFTILR